MFTFDNNPTPYDLCFRVGQTPVRVNPFFWIMAVLLGWNYSQPPFNLGYLVLWIAAVFFSILLHELGHVWMGRVFGSQGYILLWSFGGLAIGSSDQRVRWQRILVYFAGPGIQFILYGIVWALARWGLPYVSAEWFMPVWIFAQMLLGINWYWPILNLFPIWPLDGGRITREVCEAVSPRKGVLTSLGISAIVSGILALHCLLSYNGRGLPILENYFSGSLFSGIFFAMFCVGSIQAYQQERERGRAWHDDDLPWER